MPFLGEGGLMDISSVLLPPELCSGPPLYANSVETSFPFSSRAAAF